MIGKIITNERVIELVRKNLTNYHHPAPDYIIRSINLYLALAKQNSCALEHSFYSHHQDARQTSEYQGW